MSAISPVQGGKQTSPPRFADLGLAPHCARRVAADHSFGLAGIGGRVSGKSLAVDQLVPSSAGRAFLMACFVS